MVNIVKLRLSGSSDKLYEYLWDYNMEPQVYVTQGIRAVVPSKIKDDGSLSLAIGTVEEVLMNMHEDYLDPSIQYKHVVCFISPHAMNVAEQRMKELAPKVEEPCVAKALAASIEQIRNKHGV